MSPVSRGRRGKKKTNTRRVARARLWEAEPTGLEIFEAMLDSAAATFTELATREDPLPAELVAALLIHMPTALDPDAGTQAVAHVLIPMIEARQDTAALAALTALESVSAGVQDEIADFAAAAATSLRAAGVAEPRWAGDLGEPVELLECHRLHGKGASEAVLAASFRRAGRAHAFVVLVDTDDCGAATDILLPEASELPGMLDEIVEDARKRGTKLKHDRPAVETWHWHVRDALDARAVHDRDTSLPEPEEPEEDGPPYGVMAQVLRSRLATLPAARQPRGAKPAHSDPLGDLSTLDERALQSVISQLLAARGGDLNDPAFPALPGRRPDAKLPAKRNKADGPAPVLQIKVGLTGSKPPIWRRVLVPGDISLASLHHVIQTAFGWEDAHMHVFETPYGSFGRSDRELGHKAEGPVTLEHIAGRPKDKINYLYDFGDNWDHQILVEKVLDPDPSLTKARCIGGRRAAPPEDCGGVWGYMELIDVIADPHHPEHADRMDWLGLTNPAQFDPEAFDPDAINHSLAGGWSRGLR